MSLLKVTITENHLKLLKQLKWSINQNNFLVGTEDEFIDKDFAPFGSNTLYEGMDLILNGQPEDEDVLKSDERVYTEEEKAYYENLYKELPLALEAILNLQTFENGNYVTKYHDRAWKKK